MAHAIAVVGAQGLTDKEPASGAVELTAEIPSTAQQTRGIWVFIDVAAAGWASAPGGYLGDPPALVVSIFPSHTTAGALMDDGDVYHQKVFQVGADYQTLSAVMQFAHYFEGDLPEFFMIGVQNRTDTDMASNKLDMFYEYKAESTA